MATATSHLTLEEFHRRFGDSEKPYREYWFGEVVSKAMPTGLHGMVQFVVMLLLRARAWKPASEVRLKISCDFEPVPDVVASKEGIDPRYPTKAMDLCVEILSPGDRLKKVIDKAGYYLALGVRYVWVIDPEARTAWVVSEKFPQGVWIHPDGVLAAGEGTEIALKEIFEEVDQLIPQGVE
jgi:Uma2 family endonuclease